MQISEAKFQDGWLMLKAEPFEARRFCYEFKAGQYDLSKAKKRRSLDANAYAWVLMNKLAEELRMPVMDVYRDAIREIGGNKEIVCMMKPAAERMKRIWEKNGKGFQTEEIPCKIPNCVTLILHYGSHLFDTKQMSVLIDYLVQECRNQSIETKSPEEIDSLLRSWDG